MVCTSEILCFILQLMQWRDSSKRNKTYRCITAQFQCTSKDNVTRAHEKSVTLSRFRRCHASKEIIAIQSK